MEGPSQLHESAHLGLQTLELRTPDEVTARLNQGCADHAWRRQRMFAAEPREEGLGVFGPGKPKVTTSEIGIDRKAHGLKFCLTERSECLGWLPD